jgi:RNA polymerase sigma factor (sigma-70 family)
MRRHGDEMLRFCFSALGDAAAAEDVRQIIFVQAYQGLAGYQGRGSLRGWLYGIARHQVLDAGKAWRRRRWRFPLAAKAGEQEVATEAGPEGQLEQSRRSAVLHRCLRELQAATRVLVLLRYEQGMQYEEIARMTRDRPATVQARVARALPKLRDCLESKGIQL